jgi:hypothetical protein
LPTTEPSGETAEPRDAILIPTFDRFKRFYGHAASAGHSVLVIYG